MGPASGAFGVGRLFHAGSELSARLPISIELIEHDRVFDSQTLICNPVCIRSLPLPGQAPNPEHQIRKSDTVSVYSVT